ncbi:MAG: hypothetical protein ACYC3H_01285 [Bellilinea sp.]
MKINVNRRELAKGLKIIGQFTKDQVLMDASGYGTLRLAALSPEVFASVKVHCRTQEGGQIGMDPRQLSRTVQALTGEEIEIQTETPGLFIPLQISDERVKATLTGTDPTKLLSAKQHETVCTRSIPHLLDLASRVMFAASEDLHRQVLTNVRFNGRIEASDGFRIAMVPNIENGLEGLVPAKFLRTARRIFRTDELKVNFSDTWIALSNGTVTLEGPLGSGKWFETDSILPKSVKMTAKFQTYELRVLLGAVDAVYSGNVQHLALFEFDETGRVKISSESGENRVVTSCKAEIQHQDDFKFPFSVGLDMTLLRDMLIQAGPEVTFGFNARNTPVEVQPEDLLNSWYGVIMPMHVGTKC